MGSGASAPVGIEAIAYALPPGSPSVGDLYAAGRLRGSAETLTSFGFRHARVATTETHVDLARAAVADLLATGAVAPAEIDVLLFAAALASSSSVPPAAPGGAAGEGDVMDLFRYPVSQLQHEFDLVSATTAGVAQQGCAAIFSAIRIARGLLAAEDETRTVLCVGADRLPPEAPRELVYNLVSDGACAVLLRKGAERNQIVAYEHVTKGAMWDAAPEHEVVAAYFPTAKMVIERAVRRAGIALEDVAWFVPHNVSLRSWEILLGLLRVPRERLFADNIGRLGHTIAADNFVNLKDLLDAGRVRPGDFLVLFTFGFGLNWSCLVLRH